MHWKDSHLRCWPVLPRSYAQEWKELGRRFASVPQRDKGCCCWHHSQHGVIPSRSIMAFTWAWFLKKATWSIRWFHCPKSCQNMLNQDLYVHLTCSYEYNGVSSENGQSDSWHLNSIDSAYTKPQAQEPTLTCSKTYNILYSVSFRHKKGYQRCWVSSSYVTPPTISLFLSGNPTWQLKK